MKPTSRIEIRARTLRPLRNGATSTTSTIRITRSPKPYPSFMGTITAPSLMSFGLISWRDGILQLTLWMTMQLMYQLPLHGTAFEHDNETMFSFIQLAVVNSPAETWIYNHVPGRNGCEALQAHQNHYEGEAELDVQALKAQKSYTPWYIWMKNIWLLRPWSRNWTRPTLP